MSSSSSSSSNVFLLAADNPARLLDVLRSDPSKASSQDEHGYSLLHAAASYNHLDLLRSLVTEYGVDVNIRDEDGETPLYVAETVDCAKLLVEELQASITITNSEAVTPREKIASENEFVELAVYLRTVELERQVNGATDHPYTAPPPAPVPEGVSVDFGTMAPEDVGEVGDPELRRRIEELAARDDFHEDAGQDALRNVILAALRGEQVDGTEGTREAQRPRYS